MKGWHPLRHWTLARRQALTACVKAVEPLRLPLDCANCLAASTHVVRCAVPGSALLIPYCSRCYQCIEATKTRLTFAVCVSLFCGLGALVAVPLSALHVSVLEYALVTLLSAALPVLIGTLLRPRPSDSQSSADVAVWGADHAIVGTNTRWITQLSDQNAGRIFPRQGRVKVWRWSIWCGVVVLPLLAASAYSLLYPTVAVLNLSAGEFELWIDGRRQMTVSVSSLESADAVSRVNVPVGRHQFEARLTAEDELLQSVDVNIEALGLYLFAPGAKGRCFWTESAAYGKADLQSERRPLGGKDGLIVLPSRIDTWFGPNPPAGNDSYSSGGEMVAVRHGPCSE